MEISEKLKLHIADTRENGAGVARHGGAVVFVPSLVEGDVADIVIKEIHKNFAVGEAVRIITQSPHRVTPVCTMAEECGGCTLAHVSYEYENLVKRETVRSALRRAGLPQESVGATAAESARTGYRNKLTLHFDRARLLLGLYREGTNHVVPFRGCAICAGNINEAAVFLAENANLLSVSGADEVTLKSSIGGKVTVLLKTGGDISPIAETVSEALPFVSAVMRYSDADGEYVYGEYGGLCLRFSALGFRQVNDAAFSSLLNIVVTLAEKCEFKHCADLYCGSGIIGLTLASHFPHAHFYGTEINKGSIEDAKHNAESNGLGNISFFCGDAAAFRASLPNDGSPELIVLDPPRAGLSDKMKRELYLLSPENIIYVSCNPQTLARDLKELVAHGYAVSSVTPVNMFPMTKHTECVVKINKL